MTKTAELCDNCNKPIVGGGWTVHDDIICEDMSNYIYGRACSKECAKKLQKSKKEYYKGFNAVN